MIVSLAQPVALCCFACRRCSCLYRFPRFFALSCVCCSFLSIMYVHKKPQQKHATRNRSPHTQYGWRPAHFWASRIGSSSDASGGRHRWGTATSASGIGPHNRSASTSCTDTPAPHCIHSRSFEHRGVLQHIRDDEKPDHAASDVNLI